MARYVNLILTVQVTALYFSFAALAALFALTIFWLYQPAPNASLLWVAGYIIVLIVGSLLLSVAVLVLLIVFVQRVWSHKLRS